MTKPPHKLFTAKIDPDWYLYSSDFDPELGPTVTTFVFTPDKSFERLGSVQPQAPSSLIRYLWVLTLILKTGTFIQNIQLNEPNYRIKGFYSYQVCSDVGRTLHTL